MGFKYACTALAGTTKTGELTPDEDGYYTLIVGALDFYNSIGKFYDYATSHNQLEDNSAFMRRVSGGNLYAEHNHPECEHWMSQEDYIWRIRDINPERVCAHISEVWGEWDNLGPNGERVWVIYAKVKPDGVRGHLLLAALQNKKQNVCFSLRSLVDDNWIGGKCIRTILELITFDWVIEPGISIANKFANPALEAYQDLEHQFSNESIEACIKKQRANVGLGLESSESVDELERIYRNTMKHDEVRFERPKYLRF